MTPIYIGTALFLPWAYSRIRGKDWSYNEIRWRLLPDAVIFGIVSASIAILMNRISN
jgi:hypothetical protein